MKKIQLFALLTVAALLITACQSAASPAGGSANAAAEDAPEVCATDSFGCAVFKPGAVIKIGMGAPMTGGDAAYGIDISQGGFIAVEDFGELNGFKFELIAEDDQGTAEGGAAVANKFASDPAVVAVAGHIYSGATSAAMPVYEKVGIPMLSPSASLPALTTMGSAVFNRIVFTDARQGPPAAEYLFNKSARASWRCCMMVAITAKVWRKPLPLTLPNWGVK
jgi:ABC-type branched-subunit amino acid transport system substrate-binding protein